MRATLTITQDPPDLILVAQPNHFWWIANIPVLAPLLTTSASNLKPTIVTIELKPEAAIDTADKYLSPTSALVIMKPYEVEALQIED